MTVKELIEELEKIEDKNLEILMENYEQILSIRYDEDSIGKFYILRKHENV